MPPATSALQATTARLPPHADSRAPDVACRRAHCRICRSAIPTSGRRIKNPPSAVTAPGHASRHRRDDLGRDDRGRDDGSPTGRHCAPARPTSSISAPRSTSISTEGPAVVERHRSEDQEAQSRDNGEADRGVADSSGSAATNAQVSRENWAQTVQEHVEGKGRRRQASRSSRPAPMPR